ncbi:hypothetical protein QTP81_08125 [Alteromonas sp. ASW11-36]|uniref:HEPN domain-containing protein n=1 Tax=Alteromonas arenosi TaxID=3055817 RepID=A0ABT7SWJ3_9ALTE|nr:hypothetical protein [Alteromonas sp. ASW11-36]MDM7860560.1 hypothetical protein [Alteromonas sp. ASW11-36]
MNRGKRFSQVYLKADSTVKDSLRMRNRLSAIYWDLLTSENKELVKKIHIETGAKVPFVAGSYSLSDFFESCDIRDLLDSVTIVFQHYHFGTVNSHKASKWHAFVSRVFSEESLGYRLDDLGGVHFFQDEEFERSRNATLAGLDSQPAIKEAFEKSYALLDRDPPDTASAIRAVFEALEITYKHLINAKGKERLNSHGVQKNLKSLFQAKLTDRPVELNATEHLLDGFCDWIDAAHMYRHGQKIESTEAPSIDFAVMFISQGASYLRFLLHIK